MLATLATAVLLAATPVQGSISGPISAVGGTTFVVKTTLSPTGSSKVSVGSKTTLTEQLSGSTADLRKGVCVTASGTTKGSAVVAARVSVRTAVEGSCTGGFGGRFPGGRPPGTRGTNPPGPGGFAPAGLGFAVGEITAVKGSTLTVKGSRGDQTVTVSATTAITKTEIVSASSLRKSLCAFVFGTSTDKGVTVQAESVALSQPVGGSCTFRRRPS